MRGTETKRQRCGGIAALRQKRRDIERPRHIGTQARMHKCRGRGMETGGAEAGVCRKMCGGGCTKVEVQR